MRRGASEDITLSDGTFLRKGSEFLVSVISHWDPEIYSNPLEWEGLRFYHLRQQPGKENLGQASVTSNEHLVSTKFGSRIYWFCIIRLPVSLASYFNLANAVLVKAFGHGQHACPGRFFAINEVKVLASHLIMKYDFRLVGPECKIEKIGTGMLADSKAKLEVRRREPEIDLDNLEVS